MVDWAAGMIGPGAPLRGERARRGEISPRHCRERRRAERVPDEVEGRRKRHRLGQVGGDRPLAVRTGGGERAAAPLRPRRARVCDHDRLRQRQALGELEDARHDAASVGELGAGGVVRVQPGEGDEQRRQRVGALSELAAALERRLHCGIRVVLGDEQRGAESEVQEDQPIGALRAVGEQGDDRDRASQRGDRLAVRAAPGVERRRLLEILRGAAGVVATLEVHRQLRRDVVRARAVGVFEAAPDTLVQHARVRGREPCVERAAVELVRELEGGGDGAVGPFGDAGGADEMPIARERVAARLQRDQLLLDGGGEAGGGELRADRARGLEEPPVGLVEMLRLAVDHQAQALRHPESGVAGIDLPRAVAVRDELRIDERAEEGDQKQRVALGAAMQPIDERARRRRAPRFQPALHGAERQAAERQLRALLVRAQLLLEAAQRVTTQNRGPATDTRRAGGRDTRARRASTGRSSADPRGRERAAAPPRAPRPLRRGAGPRAPASSRSRSRRLRSVRGWARGDSGLVRRESARKARPDRTARRIARARRAPAERHYG